MMKLNKKGMTLIEILVVLVITSLVMVIACSLILNGLGYFNKTASSDVDKLVTDNMVSFIRDELVYASDVRIATDAPDSNEWHYIGLNEKSYLEMDGEQLYPDSYYNNNNLKLSAYVYKNKSRVDLKFALMEGNKAQYTTKTTIELINIQSQIMGTSAEKVQESANYDYVDISNTTKNRIYYQKGKYQITDDPYVPPVDEPSGTVGDEIACKTEDNTELWSTGRNYKKGTFVYFGDSWYRAVVNIKSAVGTPLSNTNGEWKLISKQWNANSVYEKDDVVNYINTGKYYKKIYDYKPLEKGNIYAPESTSYKGWIEIDEKDIPPISCEIPMDSNITVGSEYERCPQGEIKEWSPGLHLTPGDYVQYTDGQVYRFISSSEYNWNILKDYPPGTNALQIWKKIDDYFNSKSTYYKGDIVIDVDPNDNKEYYYQCIEIWANTGHRPFENANVWKKLNDISEAEKPTCKIFQ